MIIITTPQKGIKKIFKKYNIKHIVTKSAILKNPNYIALLVLIINPDNTSILQATSELERDILVCGHNDYPDICYNQFNEILDINLKEIQDFYNQKEENNHGNDK